MAEARVRDALRVVAAPGDGTRAPLLPPIAHEAAIVDAIARERLTGMALDAYERGMLDISAAALDDLHERHEAQLLLDLRLEGVLLDAAETLEHAGIEFRVLKGPALAHTVYPDPALRSFGDVDLLVPGDAFDDAIDALRPLAFERRFTEPRPRFDARFSKGACVERPDGMEIDLHRTLAPGPFGVRLGRADLFAPAPRRFTIAGHELAGLGPELAFVHACFHAALGDHPARFVPLRDVVELTRTGFDAGAVVAFAAEVQCGAVFRRAVELVDRELGVKLAGPLAVWARAHHPSRFDRFALAGYTRADRSYARQTTASFLALRRVRERVSFATALAFPARDYVRARERSYTRRLVHGLHLANESRPR